MTVIRKTISLTPQQDEWIKQRLAHGDYTNESEYFRDLIRHDQEDQSKIEAIKNALIEGEESGQPVAFSRDEYMKNIRKRLGDIRSEAQPIRLHTQTKSFT